MRYYDIVVAGMAEWTSRINGQHNPKAQQIEMQLQLMNHAPVASEASTLTIYGIPWEFITQAYDFSGKPISIYGGMAPGLPLATFQSRTAGLLMQATIIKCWGNWIGTEMSLGMAFVPSGSFAASTPYMSPTGIVGRPPADPENLIYTRVGRRSMDNRPFPRGPVTGLNLQPAAFPTTRIGGAIGLPIPSFGEATSTVGGVVNSLFGGGSGGLALINPLNLVHDLQPNQPLSGAIAQTLGRAFPQANLNIRISDGLKLGYQDAGMYQAMDQYAQYIKHLSHSILGTDGYLGVHMSTKDNTIDVWDGTKEVGFAGIDALDLIGQPTWIDRLTVSIKTAMRADIKIGMDITLPPTLMTITESSQVPYAGVGTPPAQRTNDSFSGSFKVIKVLHIGDFRNPDSANWSTNIEALAPGAMQDPTGPVADN